MPTVASVASSGIEEGWGDRLEDADSGRDFGELALEDDLTLGESALVELCDLDDAGRERDSSDLAELCLEGGLESVLASFRVSESGTGV